MYFVYSLDQEIYFEINKNVSDMQGFLIVWLGNAVLGEKEKNTIYFCSSFREEQSKNSWKLKQK